MCYTFTSYFDRANLPGQSSQLRCLWTSDNKGVRMIDMTYLLNTMLSLWTFYSHLMSYTFTSCLWTEQTGQGVWPHSPLNLQHWSESMLDMTWIQHGEDINLTSTIWLPYLLKIIVIVTNSIELHPYHKMLWRSYLPFDNFSHPPGRCKLDKESSQWRWPLDLWIWHGYQLNTVTT